MRNYHIAIDHMIIVTVIKIFLRHVWLSILFPMGNLPSGWVGLSQLLSIVELWSAKDYTSRGCEEKLWRRSIIIVFFNAILHHIMIEQRSRYHFKMIRNESMKPPVDETSCSLRSRKQPRNFLFYLRF